MTAKKEKEDKPLIDCENCGKPTEQTRDWKRFCSEKCKFTAWNKKHPRMKVE